MKSINLIKSLEANLQGTNIYRPLQNIYESKEYDNINLERKIFILTDGEIKDKEKTLEIIKQNRKMYSIHSIGIGEDFDEDLIKKMGI